MVSGLSQLIVTAIVIARVIVTDICDNSGSESNGDRDSNSKSDSS